MFNLVEIDKITLYEGIFTPISPYIYQTQISNTAIATYWTLTFGASGDYNDIVLDVPDFTFDSSYNLLKQESYNDMLNQVSSFYFDYDTQLLTINLAKNYNPYSAGLSEIGILYGYSDDTVRIFDDRQYFPIVQSIPSITEQTDPLQYGIIAFSSGSIELSNPIVNNKFLFNAFDKFYGSKVEIKRGEEGETYEDLTTVFSGYISNSQTSTNSQTFTLGDNREKLEIDYPTEVFNVGIDDSDDKIIPDGYGNVIQVPAYPTTIGSTSVQFRWASVATSISHVYTYTEDEGLVELTAGQYGVSTVSPLAEGYFYVLNANIYVDGDTDNNLKDVYVTGRMRDFDNPADIISDLNSRVLGIEYNSTNYDTAEWTTEKADLADVYLYMSESKSLYEWIEKLQSGSNYGFRYEDVGKRTIRLDKKDRTLITFDDGTSSIEPIDIRNSDIPIDQNADLYASTVIVKHSYNHRLKTYQQVTNDDFYDQVIQEFRIASIDTYESLLTNSTDADSKALIIADDEKTIRPLIELTVESSKYKKPRIYDIIEATASLLVQGAYQSDYTNLMGDTDVLGDDYALGELWGLTFSEARNKGIIDYYGNFIGEVLGINPNTDDDTVTITLRDITNLRS